MQNSFTPTAPKKIWSARLIGWLTLIFGPASGFIVAGTNWAFMGHKQKAILHGLIGVGVAFLYPLILREYIGLSRRDTVGLSFNEHVFRIILNFGSVFLIIAYIYLTTEKDTQRLQESGIPSEKANLFLAVMIAILASLGSVFLNALIINAQQASFQNHVYCELLKPGMTYAEVDNALAEIGPHLQAHLETIFPKTESVDYESFRVVRFEGAIETKYNLSLGLGYDENDRLLWVAKFGLPSGFEIVQCPTGD